MGEWEFYSSSHIVFIDSGSLKAQSERLGEGTETEVSDTVLELLCVLTHVNRYSEIDLCVVRLYINQPTDMSMFSLVEVKIVELNENCTVACQKMSN